MSVFFGDVEMIEHSAHNDPTVVAHAAVPNGYFFIVSSGASAVPTAGGELWVAINTPLGDDRYLADVTIPAGAKLNAYRLIDWDDRHRHLHRAREAQLHGHSRHPREDQQGVILRKESKGL